MHKVFVIEKMTQQCLLGTDYLELYHCVVDLGKRTLTVAPATLLLGAPFMSCDTVGDRQYSAAPMAPSMAPQAPPIQ